MEKITVSVETTVNAPVDKVWRLWTNPKHIIRWNNASDDWHTPKAENDLRVGGRFVARMEAKDGSDGFDFAGVYLKVEKNSRIEYRLDDGREVQVLFIPKDETTTIMETFAAEQTHSTEEQRMGWQAILDNFKDYVEKLCSFNRLHFEVTINARLETVYKALTSDAGFREWTSVFGPKSHFEGTWEKGSRMLFLGEDKEGKTEGMVCLIRENIPNRYISIEYTALYRNGMEISEGAEARNWVGGMENYSMAEVNRTTILSVDVDTNPEMKTYFLETWPRALDRLKQVCSLLEK